MHEDCQDRLKGSAEILEEKFCREYDLQVLLLQLLQTLEA